MLGYASGILQMPAELMEYYLGKVRPIPTSKRPLPNRAAGKMTRESTVYTKEEAWSLIYIQGEKERSWQCVREQSPVQWTHLKGMLKK